MGIINRRSATFTPFLLLTALVLSGCTLTDNNGGSFTVNGSDTTPPVLTLSVAQQGGGSTVDIAPGESSKTLELTSKTETINIVANATDDEGGIQEVEIWLAESSSTCSASGLCQSTGPGLQSAPVSEFTEPQRNPGEAATRAASHSFTIDTKSEVPQGGVPAGESHSWSFHLWAVARNHLGQTVNTAEIVATYQEP